MAHHVLKINGVYYEAKVAGDKPFEIRYNDDRGFQKGDTVKYMSGHGYSPAYPREGIWQITYVTNYSQKDGYVVFGDKRIDLPEVE